VIRGGYGVVYERIEGNDMYDGATNPPFGYTFNTNNVLPIHTRVGRVPRLRFLSYGGVSPDPVSTILRRAFRNTAPAFSKLRQEE